jgi:hypothetical protein
MAAMKSAMAKSINVESRSNESNNEWSKRMKMQWNICQINQ